MGKKTTRMLAWMLAIALLLAGCQSKQPETTPAATESAAASEAPAEETAEAPSEAPAEPTPTEEAAAEVPAAGSVTITDVVGRTVTLDAPAKKIVGTHNPTMNQAIILGGGGKYIAGFGNKKMAGELYKLVYPELENDVPQIGKGKEINFETVLGLQPDLALLPERFADQAEKFEEVGIKAAVVLPNQESFDTIKESLQRVAVLLGEEERAAQINAFFDAKVEDAKAIAAQGSLKPKMLYLGGSSPLSVANGAMLQSVMMETVGGVNVAKDVAGEGDFIEVSIEEIVGWNPEIVYVPVFASYKVEDILNDPAWQSVQAVKDKKVYQFPSKLEPWDYPTPSVCLGLAWLIHNVYPELYTADQLLQDSQEYYNMVYGQTFTAEQLGLQ